MKEMEVLAPAGSFETLKAVIKAGADAVYLGGPAYGARAYAGNFTQEELLQAIDYAHLRNCKVYLTVNTLLKNSEIQGLKDYLMPYYRQGLDAVLVQDIGVLSYLHRVFPDLPLHTSTQMTVASADGVRQLQEYGVTRVVMARETSISEMKRIHEETGMELEAFVHGALCYSYSGQCLFSSMLGGRSGNRGRCAQPCRLSYTVLDQNKKLRRKESYCLSLKDLCGLQDIEALQEAGVYSLKIEGRMKSPAYAAGVVSVYRRYVDRLQKGRKAEVKKVDLDILENLGSRCGFTDHYYYKHNGSSMVTFAKPNFASKDPAVTKEMEGLYVGQEDKLEISGTGFFAADEPSCLTLQYKDHMVTVYGQAPSQAVNKPVTEADIADRLRKTGQTDFIFSQLELYAQEGIFLPNGAINQLRRDALDALREELLSARRREGEVHEAGLTAGEGDSSDSIRFTASCETFSQWEVLLQEPAIRRIYGDIALYQEDSAAFEKMQRLTKEAGREFLITLPVICRSYTAATLNGLRKAGVFETADGFLINNYEELQWCRTNYPGKILQTNHNLYAWNDFASEALKNLGADGNTMPLELSAGEIAGRDNTNSEMILYGYYPLMTTAGCVHANTGECDHKAGITYLKDRYQVLFPVKNRCSECTNIIYNSLPTCLFDQLERLQKQKISAFRMAFTLEDRDETEKILGYFRNTLSRKGKCKPEGITNGHYKRGVE